LKEIMSISSSYIDQIKREWNEAQQGQKTRVVEKWAGLLNCSPKKIYAVVNTGRKRKPDGCRIEGLEEVVETIFKVKKKPPESAGEISTDQAYKLACQSGLIPAKLPPLSVSLINRVGRRLTFNRKKRRIQRFQAERPNQMHHIDASSSQFFYVARALEDGDYLLKMHSPAMHNKNKPIPCQVRPWIYGLVDDYSGYSIARYTAAPGESMSDNLDFLSWAWSKNADKPFFGIPEKLKADKGPMMRGKAALEWLERLGIEIEPSVPYAKEAHGKIERPWRTLWQRFEKPFFALGDWRKFEIRLSELNRQFFNYLQEYNQGPHRFEKDITREQAWRKINQFGGAVALPENAIALTAERKKRKVGTDGCISIDGMKYEVKGLHDAWVYVIRGVFEDKIIVEHVETGEKYEVEDFKPNPVGTFTAHKETPHQKVKKAAQELDIRSTLYGEEIPATNVVPIPTRTKEERLVENVFNTGSFNSLQEAMSEFISITGQFIEAGSEERQILEKLFLQKKLSKSFVREVAGNVIKSGNSNRRVNHG